MSVNISGEGRAYFGRDNDGPELRFSAGGTAYLNFSIQFYQGKDQDKGYINAIAFNQLAENLAESLENGDSITFTGVLDHSKYETNDGQKRTSLKVRLFDAGASMRWAPVRPVRTDGGSSGYGGGQAAPAAAINDTLEAPF